jgi:ubiquinone/menaquinone biosynthesis C-methylase UbiE
MAEMNFAEKFIVNSRAYNFIYRNTLLRWFLDFCDLKGNCLEIGCGPGFTSLEIRKKLDGDLTSIDYDEDEVEKAKKRLSGKKVAIMQADATKLPFKDGSFDCVVEMNTFHHISEYRKAISESFRVLKKGGQLYIMDISRYFLWPLTLLLPFEHFDGKFTRDGMIDDLEAAGFRISKKKGWDVFMISAEKN